MKNPTYRNKKPFRNVFYYDSCLVIQYDGYRKVYSCGSPFAVRQPPHDLEPLSDFLADAIESVAHSWRCLVIPEGRK